MLGQGAGLGRSFLSTASAPHGCLADWFEKNSRNSSFRQKEGRQPLRLHSQSTAAWGESRLAPLRVQLQNGWPGLQGCSSDQSRPPDRELQRFCKEGQVERALDLLSRMDEQGIVPTRIEYKAVLKACTKSKSLAQAKRVHAHLARHGLESILPLGETVVSTFVKCGGLDDALEVFRRLPSRTVVSWTAIISGYCSYGQGQQAMRMYRWMKEEGVQPKRYTLVSLMKACGSIADLEEGKRIHAEAVKLRCDTDLFVGTCLVDMYAKCGSISDVHDVFERLSQRNVVSWTTILSAYAEQGQAEKVLELYREMRKEGVSPNDRTFVNVLQACGMLAEKEADAVVDGRWMKLKSFQQGKTIHAHAWRNGYESDVFVASTLVTMYGKCGSIVDAQNAFEVLRERDVVLWTAMIAVYVQHNEMEKALHLYSLMQEEGVNPNVGTYAICFQACGMLAEGGDHVVLDGQSVEVKSLARGKAMHEAARMKSYLFDVIIGNSLISMYGRCGSIVDARYVFDGLTQRDVVSWNAMLAAHIQQGQAEHVLSLYAEMLEQGVSPNNRTFVNTVQACGMLAEKEEDDGLVGQFIKVSSLGKGKVIQAEAWMKGYKSEVFVGNTLIGVYGKCASLEDAELVFYGLPHGSVVPWNAMLSAYLEHGLGDRALMFYRKMQEKGICPNEITLVSILQACGNTGCLDICRQIHEMLVASGNHFSLLMGNTLIHTYGRCAQMVDAKNVFNALAKPNVVSWNALIAGYAREGNVGAGLQCYAAMLLAGTKPNGVTFVSLLSLCSHAGLVDIGIAHFESMTKYHGITPDLEHYATMVDLLGRAGYLTTIEDLFSTMPVKPNLPMWLSFLNCCRMHGDVSLAKQVFEHAVKLRPRHAGTYVLMSNIYADAGLLDCAKALNELRLQAGALKDPGESWISHELAVHSFVVKNSKHPQQEQVDVLLGKLSKDLEENEKFPQPHFSLDEHREIANKEAMCGYSVSVAEQVKARNTANRFVQLKACSPG